MYNIPKEISISRRFNDLIFSFTSKYGFCFKIYISKIVVDYSQKNRIENLWYKKGYIKEKIPTWIHCDVYACDPYDNCYGICNPTEKNGKIDFNWLLEYTDENVSKIINEVYRRSSDESYYGNSLSGLFIITFQKNVIDKVLTFVNENGYSILRKAYRKTYQRLRENVFKFVDSCNVYEEMINSDVEGCFISNRDMVKALYECNFPYFKGPVSELNEEMIKAYLVSFGSALHSVLFNNGGNYNDVEVVDYEQRRCRFSNGALISRSRSM